jgi:hypothetical protein
MNTSLSALLVALGLVLPAATAHADQRRFAVFVGSNIGDRHESILHHAEDDAARVAQTLRTLGDFPPDQVLVLNGVNAPELRDAIIRLNMRVREQHDAVLLLFYSGHADAESLHLAGTHFPLPELKGLLVGSPATSRVLVVDACRSGSLIGLKGAQPTEAFSVATIEEPAPEGFAVLASSTATENAQESQSLGGSFFTHYLNSGLLGAADLNRDGAVTLSELYAFASSETRAATVSSPAGQQTPTFQFMLGGRHDLVLTHPGRRDERMGIVEFAEAGRYIIQPWNAGILASPTAEMASHDPGGKLALPPGHYRITRRGQRDIAERDLDVTGGETVVVAASAMNRVDLGRVVRKGDVRKSATGFAVMAGWKTNEKEWTMRYLEMGSGPTMFAMLRHDRRHFSLEARLGLEREVISNPAFEIENQALSLAVAALFPFDLRAVTVSLGAEVGWVLVHQSYALSSGDAYQHVMPVSTNTSLTHRDWSDGLQFGPLAQLDLPMGQGTYLRFEAGFPFRFFSSTVTWPNAPETSAAFHKGIHVHVVAGAGVSF